MDPSEPGAWIQGAQREEKAQRRVKKAGKPRKNAWLSGFGVPGRN